MTTTSLPEQGAACASPTPSVGGEWRTHLPRPRCRECGRICPISHKGPDCVPFIDAAHQGTQEQKRKSALRKLGGDRRSGPSSRPPGRTLTGSWLPNGLADGFWLRGREKSSWGVWRDVGSSPWPAESVAQNVLIANTLRRLQTIAKCCTRGRLKILRRSTPNFQGSIEPCSSGD